MRNHRTYTFSTSFWLDGHLEKFWSSARDFIVNGSILTKPHFANSHFKSKFGHDGGLVQVQLGSKYQLAIECGLKFGDFEKIQQQASNYCITGGFQSSSFTLRNWLNLFLDRKYLIWDRKYLIWINTDLKSWNQ